MHVRSSTEALIGEYTLETGDSMKNQVYDLETENSVATK